MEKEFVPHEYALELKEIGFNGHSFGYYHNLGSKQLLLSKRDLREDSNDSIQYFLAPTFSQAFRWFDDNTECSGYIVPSIKERHFDWLIIIDEGEQFECEEAYSSRLEAEIACLKKLIEIAKNK